MFNNIEVPDHILDMVAHRAEAYAERSQERWLANLSEDDKKNAIENSTHHLVRNPERRALHRKILEEISRGVLCDAPEGKPTLLYICGPMAVGKTALTKHFKSQVEENSGAIIGGGSLDHPSVTALRKIFSEVSGRVMPSDFELYKKSLPEFERSNSDFALIRPEASGLDQAVNAWAKELKVHSSLEHLGDEISEEWISQQKETHRLVVVGVTDDPEKNKQRLHARNAEKNEAITDGALFTALTGFSGESGWQRTMKLSDEAFLVYPDARLIHHSVNEEMKFQDQSAFQNFLNLRKFSGFS